MSSSRRQQRASADADHNPNVFDDEYEVDVPETELDHRPLERSASREEESEASTRVRSRSRGERRSMAKGQETAADANSQQRNLRRSIAKDPRDFVRGAAGGGSAGTRTPRGNADGQSGMRNRPISTASDFAPFEDRSSTPVHGRTAGGGDEYPGFSQSGLPRSSFASHTPSRQSSVLAQARPAQPYGLYNQTGLGADEDDDVSEAAAPIGFPGSRRRNDFERRIGPDGEEQDIIGPDGHTEQLPPYSKYPDNHTSSKIAVTTVSSVPGGARVLSPILPSPTSPVIDVPQRTPGLEAGGPGSTGSDSFNEKKHWKDKSFAEKRRTRVCGGCLPLWALIIILGVVLVCGVVIGGVVGKVMASKSGGDQPTVTVTSTASLLDASPIAAPTGVPPLPTGVFIMPFGIPQEQQKSCVMDTNQYNTWECNTPPQPAILRVGGPPTDDRFMDMLRNITSGPPSNGTTQRYNFNYGAQHPTLGGPQRLFWVKDVEEPNRGPALHFQTLYDKLVILDADQFRPIKAKRDAEGFGGDDDDDDDDIPPPSGTLVGAPVLASTITTTSSSTTTTTSSYSSSSTTTSSSASATPTEDAQFGEFYNRKNAVSVGDQPWFCWWNQTWVEGFVYVNTFTPAVHDMDKRAASPALSREIHPRDPDFPLARDLWNRAVGSYGKRAADPPPAGGVMGNSAPQPTASPDCFPYIMKVQERRIPCEQMVAPYCQKMFIPAEGPPIPMLDNFGQPVIFPIGEDSASFEDQQEELREAAEARNDNDKRDFLRKRDDPSPNSCHCLWVTPPPPT